MPNQKNEITLDLIGLVFGISLSVLSLYLIFQHQFFWNYVNGSAPSSLFGILSALGLFGGIILVIKSIPKRVDSEYEEPTPF